MMIRPVQPEEVDLVADLEKKLFSDPWSQQSILETLKQNYAIMLAAFEKASLIGYIITYCISDEAEVLRIAVAGDAQRRGVGRCLLEEAVKAARERNIRKILLDVRKSNQTAIQFYSQFGFQEDGIRRSFYEKPVEDAILMSKFL